MCHLSYLWREERIEDMPISLRNLEKTWQAIQFEASFLEDLPCLQKILVQTMKYEAQNRYIFPCLIKLTRQILHPNYKVDFINKRLEAFATYI